MRLYRDFKQDDWKQILNLNDKLPKTIIVHGEWEHSHNISIWKDAILNQICTPKWNTVVGKYDDLNIGFANIYGAPQAANIVHQFASSGTQRFIQTGYFGGISENLEYGTVFIVRSALKCDGVSLHYESVTENVRSEPGLVEHAIKYCENNDINYVVGDVVSVSSLFMETEEGIKEWMGKGYIGIDMESACTITIAHFFGKQGIALLNMSDLIIKDDSLFDYSDERIALEEQTDRRIRELALYLATIE